MHFLVLTCNCGGGHNATAAAISDYFTSQGHRCTTINCLEFLPTITAKLISEGHIFLYRKAPKLFGIGYRFEEKHDPKLMRAQFSHCAKAFTKKVRELGGDATISAHVFASLITTAASRKYGLDIPHYFIATDYTCSPGVSMIDQDLYFIPHEELIEEFVSQGVPRERLIPSGIPVRPCFYKMQPKPEAREALGLPQTGKLLLLTCGSMGAGPMKELSVLLDKSMAPEDHLIVICGTNQKLIKSMEKHDLSPRVHILGFTDKIDLYMDAADVILTKAGGLSTTEALMKRLPLVYVDAIPGCETKNLDFMVDRGYAMTAKTTEELAALSCMLLKDDARLSDWRDRLNVAFPDRAVDTIYKQVEQHMSKTAAP